MESRIKSIIFDWGWTLHNPEINELFPGVPGLISKLSKEFTLVLVSLARRLSPEDRRMAIEKSAIANYFKIVLIASEDKDEMYEKALSNLNLDPSQVAVVDDRVMRGVAWGNRRGATTVWVRKGKFANEIPNKETGNPSFTINDIRDLETLLN